MIHLYTWTTPNGIKPLIMLEELGIPYELHWVNIGKGEQFAPDFVKINPNSKIPALVDESITVFESGALMIHLAEKTGRFLPASGQARSTALEWLFFQVGGVGPMFGQLGFFGRATEKVPMAIERYTKEVQRLCAVMDKRLAEADYLAGEYGIADMATFGWVDALTRFGLTLDATPHLAAWHARVAARPAVQRAQALKAP